MVVRVAQQTRARTNGLRATGDQKFSSWRIRVSNLPRGRLQTVLAIGPLLRKSLLTWRTLAHSPHFREAVVLTLTYAIASPEKVCAPP